MSAGFESSNHPHVMSKPRSLIPAQPFAVRNHLRSDGYPLSLLKLPATLGGNKKAFTFGIDISSAPVPPRRYAAELADVRLLNGDTRFLFGQSYLDDTSLESVVSVRMNPIATTQLLRSIEEMQNPGLATIAEQVGIKASPLTATFAKPQHMANMVANLAAIAVSGYETCIDFYHASAFAYKNAARTEQLEVEPVVRVDLQTAIFLSIVQRMRDLVAEMPPLPDNGE